MVLIPKFWCLNLCNNICPSFGNVPAIKMVINNELTGEETLNTINFRPNFCIVNQKNGITLFSLHEQIWSHKSFWKLLTIRFFWCMACLWTWKFLLFGFLDSVWHWHRFQINTISGVGCFHKTRIPQEFSFIPLCVILFMEQVPRTQRSYKEIDKHNWKIYNKRERLFLFLLKPM